MMVLGADLHKSSHTIAAVDGSTGELLGGKTVQVGLPGFRAVLEWARGLGPERVWRWRTADMSPARSSGSSSAAGSASFVSPPA